MPYFLMKLGEGLGHAVFGPMDKPPPQKHLTLVSTHRTEGAAVDARKALEKKR